MSRALEGGRESMQTRGGIAPGSPPQATCDSCLGQLDPDEAIEVTVTRPPRYAPGIITTRIYVHDHCTANLPGLLVRALP